MTAPFPPFELARKVADAVLYEGYLLYPYRASAAKNQARWQFGVLMPRLWSESGPDEPWSTQTECLLEPEGSTVVRVLVRFLHVQSKTVEAGPGEELMIRHSFAAPAPKSAWRKFFDQFK